MARLRWPLLVLALAAGLVAWAPALDHPFAFDDEAKILANPRLADPLSYLGALAQPGYSEDKGRVLAWLSLALDRHLFGLDPWGWNLTSLLLHLANTALLLAFGDALMRRSGRTGSLAPALAAALFAAHPLASEAVLYLNARGNLLATGFYLAALALLLGRPHRFRIPAFLTCAVAALLSKEIAISLVVVAPLAWWWTEPDRAPGTRPRQTRSALTLAALAALGLLIAVATGALAEALGRPPTLPRLLGQARALMVYLGLSLLPLPSLLSVEHVLPYPPEGGWRLALASASALALLSALAWRLRRSDPLVALLLLWPLLTHAPTTLFPRAEALVEYRAYLPLAGSALLFGLALERRPLLAFVLVPVLGALSGVRAQAWATPLALWQDAARKSPDSVRAQNNLGSALEATGRLDEAIEHYQQATRLDPGHALARYNLGTALVRRGRLAQGTAELRMALALRPGLGRARYNLGRALLLAGREAEGQAAMAAAIASDPSLRLSSPSSGN